VPANLPSEVRNSFFFEFEGFFESLRTEISPEEVFISIISPGSVKTEMRDHSFKSSDISIDFNEPDEKKMSVEV
jgi:short-subunit dehydrogenase